mgnify:CR=1 FL=1
MVLNVYNGFLICCWMTKYIVVVGGVISGVGKGVATASMARMMKERGFRVGVVKIDPYINCDAGTLRPTEHGEVWVTDDGGEIDQDLGNYERFLEEPVSKFNNITTGQVYRDLIEKERKGDFLGETVQFIPHVPNEIKSRIKKSSEDKDIVLIEVGGTVGDFENLPFLFAMKSLENEVGYDSMCYVLVSYLPIPSHIEEMKTKPTQISIRLLRESGIQPDFIFCRGKVALDEVRKRKIEIYANIKSGNVISMPDVSSSDGSGNIYRIPLDLESERVGEKLLKRLKLFSEKVPYWDDWKKALYNLNNPSNSVKIAMVGKYLDIGDYQLKDSYISVNEALKHAGAFHNCNVEIKWIDAKIFDSGEGLDMLRDFDGLLVPGGFGKGGVEGKIQAIKYARENNIPYLGLCLGLQLAVVEFARNKCGLDAGSTEIDKNVKDPVITILSEQENVVDKGGTMRLGSCKAVLKEGSKVSKLYGDLVAHERHRHRYEVNPDYHEVLESNGLVFSGKNEEGNLVEFIEIPDHNFFIATQAHPEFKSSLVNPNPLFNGFIGAGLVKKGSLGSGKVL